MRLLLNRYACRALFSAILSACGLLAQAQVTSTDGSFTAGGTTNLTLRTNGTTRATIDAAGNVGINLGGSSSLNRLQIGPNPSGWSGNDLVVSNANGGLAFFTGSSESYIWSSKPIAIRPNGVLAFVAHSDGRVGIGGSSPQKFLDVHTGVNDFATIGATLSIGQWAGLHFGYRENNNQYRKSAIVFERTDNAANGKIHILNNSVGSQSATLADARLTIDQSGRVGIGSSSPLNHLQIGPNLSGWNGNDLVVGNSNGGLAVYTSAIDTYLWGNKSISIRPGGTGIPAIFAKHDGLVGVGTELPKQTLHVKGRLYLEGTEAYPSGWLQNYFHWRGHSLIMGSEVGQYAHNAVEIKPGGSSSGALDSFLQLFTTTSPNVHFLKIQLASSGDTYFNGGNVGIGTTSPDAKLAVKGLVQVKVDLNGAIAPDYVFADNYRLPSLEQVKTYIAQYKHLPEVPSAKEMEANGVNLGEMNLLLLKKIEEMTLYQIQLLDEIQRIKLKISGLEKAHPNTKK